MTINISLQDVEENLHPKITVLGVGGSGGNAVNNMINANLEGVDFLIANTDAQALQISKCSNKIQLGLNSTRGLGAGMRPDIGKQAAEEAIEELSDKFKGSHMLFIAAGMGGGTGTGASPVIAKLARERGILTVGVVTKPFHFEGSQRMKLAEKGIEELQQYVDTLLTIPNQNLFRIANEKTTFSDAFKMADDVLYAGVRGVTDLMVQPGMINLDFSDIKTVMSEMGKAMMGTGEASGEGRAVAAAEAAIANPLIDDVSLKGAKGLIINITGGKDITLYEVDEAANRIKQEIDEEANIIYGTTCDDRLEGLVRVSIVATGIGNVSGAANLTQNSFAPISINNEVYKDNSDKIKSSAINLNEQNDDRKNINEELINNQQNIHEEDNQNENKQFNEIEQSHQVEETSENNESTLDIEEINDSSEININESIESSIEEINDEANIEIRSDNIQKNLNNLDSESDNSFEDQGTPEPNVRRLSLFDTVEDTATKENHQEIAKNEPVISEELNLAEKNINHEENDDTEFDPIKAENEELEDEFNQETEEELLDIPTFLRRQAN